MNRPFLLLLVLLAIGTPRSNADNAETMRAAGVLLVENRQAKCVIVLAADAPEAARLAAEEVRRVVQRATGAEFAIRHDRAASPAIRIESVNSLPHDGFEIRVEGRDVVIAGNDDIKPAKPDTWFVPSHGTL